MANKRINELALRTPQTTDLMLIGDPTTGYSYKTTLLSALNLGVPTTRTITINGTTFDLSANRTWSVGTVTSVGLTMPAAFNVANSPVTGSGTIAVTAAGLATQYIRGDGTLADFPGGGGGGGASVSYYLNGSVNQGTLGGVTYYEMNKTPILGAGTNFTTSSNGYIASFLTDAGDPALLKIPGGNWNTEFYFAASSGGGTPTYYIELYKYDGTTFTLIASSSSNPDAITGGTSVEQYFTTLAVPETILTATDRLAIRIYVTTAGRTITLHTENSNLCQIITTFTTGLTALNGLTAQVQYFATGSAGTDFNINSSTATHTFNIPTASATNRGLLSTADWTTFNNKVPYTGATANVDLGIYNLSAKSVFIEGTASYQSGLAMKQLNSFDFVSGAYTQIAPSSTTELNLVYNQSGGARRRAALSAAVLQNGDNFQYLFPRQNGTFAMLTDISTAINGTTNWIPRFTSANTIGLSNLYDGSSFIGVFTATDNLSGAKLQVNGAATFSGNVGIGENNPTTYKLQVKGVDGGGIQYEDTNAVRTLLGSYLSKGLIGTLTNHALGFWTNNSEKMILSTSGNLGLGVTPSAWGSGYKALQIAQSSFAGATLYSWVGNNWFDDGTGNKYIANGFSTLYEQRSGEHRFLTAPSGTAGNAITFTQAMTLTASGNLGIGTSSPGYKLEVIGVVAAKATGNGGRFEAIDGSVGGANITLNPALFTTGEPALQTQTNSPILFAPNNTERLRITSSGNVGIGVNAITSGTKLEIAGNVSIKAGTDAYFQTTDSNNVILRADQQGGTNGKGVRLQYWNGSAWQNSLSIDNVTSGFSNLLLQPSGGNVGIGTATPSYKLDIYDASGTSIVVGAATGKTYVYGDDAGGTIGTISSIPLRFSPNSTERMRINSAGRVLIGTTTDNTVDLLQVAGRVRANSLRISDNTINFDQLTDGSGALAGTNTNHYYRFMTNDTERLRIHANGGLRFIPQSAAPTAEAGTVYYDSDDNKLKVYNGTTWVDLH